ncbi:DUF3300 domain-containing protein [Cronobacter sakazakii]|uniref:DUF3300 domain-containing protein n=1 Tax=Cronobacter sakazakii TaxID=28141 RepID=UPI000CFD99EF|nr:DUF3300 domain-containing protein [Cronobacter sakazakii]MBF4935531.1 DUF3300 domain-containing protein [Cronobacter sakazakii]MBK4111590.1 DUF3300 domain-containing protein [Cronobacter sakazakii]MDI7681017.1 DUF3300 domain-containing protein [Cronobacter sakazakii]MDK1238480.1 DUF3300 domain-containing protein [Cronobacter sakazakii]PQZ39858.1 DUF3300 domain-containing protein [Cronobacter sakazakii]
MKLPLKPHLLALLCSAGLFGASGVLFVKSQVPSAAEAPVAAPPSAPVPPQPTPAPATTPTYSAAQIDQWVAPIALYPDALLSQILMASTYPMNMVQAAQWSQDHPTLQGDAAIQAVVGQPWDASVKSLVAFPQLMALLGQNPPWIQNLGDAFLAQPDDVMASVQRLRALAQQTGALTSSPQQKVTTITRTAPPVSPEKPAAAPRSSTVIEIEPASPEMVYVPTYNPATVYGTWQNPAYPPVYLPPTPGEQFGNSFVRGLGYSLGVATTYALFSAIDWDDDDHHHHHDDDYHHHDRHDGGYWHNGDNININVNNYNRITGENRRGNTMPWHPNPAYRNGIGYADSRVAAQFHSPSSATGLSTAHTPVDRASQRQAAAARFQQATGHNATVNTPHQAARQSLQARAQRSNYRGYDIKPESARLASHAHNASERPFHDATQHAPYRDLHASAFSGNDSRSARWQEQQQRGSESRHLAATHRPDTPVRERHIEHRQHERHH